MHASLGPEPSPACGRRQPRARLRDLHGKVSNEGGQPTGLSEWLARLEARHPTAIELGLERVERVWRAMGATPDFPIVTVGGTNGKGSTCAFLEAILVDAGYRVGLYTSPHLLRFNERIRVDETDLPDEAIVAALEAVEAARGSVPLTYFEHATLAAMRHFCRAGIEVAILEVGLGGRLDAVNLFDADSAVVTAVDLDHMEYLGPDREHIGREKAGIYRPDRPAICVDPDPPASLSRHVAAIHAEPFRLGRDIRIEQGEADWTCRVADAVYPALPRPALQADYQYANAAGAIAALYTLRRRLPIPVRAIRSGLARASRAGRFQVVGQGPLRILDVAHNPHAARGLARNLANLPPTGRRFAVFAMLGDKDIVGVVEALAGRFDHWYLAGLGGARGIPADELARRTGLPAGTHTPFSDVRAAWTAACQEASAADTITAFGSFHTVAEVMAVMQGIPDGA